MKVLDAFEKINELNSQINLLEGFIKQTKTSDEANLIESIFLEKQKERDDLQERLDRTELAPPQPYFRGGTVKTSDSVDVVRAVLKEL